MSGETRDLSVNRDVRANAVRRTAYEAVQSFLLAINPELYR